MADTRTILIKARELIATKGWTQGRWALDAAGKPAMADEHATCFCSWGAIVTAARGFGWDSEAEYTACCVFAEAIGAGDTGRLIKWNDAPGRTKEEVLAAFDRAIEAA